MTGRLSDDLRKMGFITTGEESPINEDGTVWRNGVEAVCDETGVIIDGNHYNDETEDEKEVYRYRNSGKVKMNGAFLNNFDWGEDERNVFRY